MSQQRIKRLRPSYTRDKEKETLVLGSPAKAALWEMVESWEAIAGRLNTFAKRQNQQQQYFTAAENSLMADCMLVCADELRAILPPKTEKEPNKAPEPTPRAVTPRALLRDAKNETPE